MKKYLLFLTVTAISANLFAQNVFTYGKNAVSKEEFLRAFNKNNNPEQDRKQALKEYLDLYIKFKLKVQAAKDMRFDTLPNQVADLRNFRRQIEDNYMNDDKMMNDMLKEAFQRSQKDIRLSHILVSVKKDAGPADTLKAYNKINAAYAALQSGKSFAEVAAQFSEDPTVKNNKGDLGFITLFTLPYKLETAAYNTANGTYSKPFRSNIGYHIFKITDERKALGKVKVQQIMRVFAPDITEAGKQEVKAKIDSIYDVLKADGSKWNEMVAAFSQDRNTVYNNGTLQEFGIGVYESSFENAAFGLQQAHELSKPFETSFGYHILRLVEKYPVESDWMKVNSAGTLKQLVSNDARSNLAREKFNEDVKKQVPVKMSTYDENNLWLLTDSFISSRKFLVFGAVNEKTVLFSFPKLNVKAGDWARYVRDAKTAGLKESSLPYKELMQHYISTTQLEYYRNHLEDYNKDFRYQLQEFKEGNLLFEVMEKNVWNKAMNDSVGQQKYYNEHKSKYLWQSSVGALMITASDKATAEEFRNKLLKDGIAGWRAKADEYSGKIIADSGRYEKSQVPVVDRTAFSKGIATVPVVSEQDGSATFAYIIEEFKDNDIRSFEDARGMVINDYQTVMEERWVQELKKKYLVTVDQKTWNDILNNK